MRLRYSEHFLRQYAAAPDAVRRRFDKQIRLPVQNLRHPSLRAKKYDAAGDIWQARVNRDWRFCFQIRAGEYHQHEIKPHPK